MFARYKNTSLILGLIGVTVACVIHAVPISPPFWTQGGADLDDAFRMTWAIPDTNEVSVPGRNGFTYDAWIDWGDTTAVAAVTAWNDADLTHSYADAPCNPQIVITGVFGTIYFNGGGDRLLVTSVDNMGDVGWETLQKSFFSCDNLLRVLDNGASEMGQVVYLNTVFDECDLLTNVQGGTWVLTNVLEVANAFEANTLKTLDMSSWDLQEATSLRRLAYQAFAWDGPGLSTIGSNVTTAVEIYHWCYALADDLSAVVNYSTQLTVWSSISASNMSYSATNGFFSTNVMDGFDCSFLSQVFNSNEITRILQDLDTSGATNGAYNSGGVNDDPTAAGWEAKTNLVAKGWTVTT